MNQLLERQKLITYLYLLNALIITNFPNKKVPNPDCFDEFYLIFEKEMTAIL